MSISKMWDELISHSMTRVVFDDEFGCWDGSLLSPRNNTESSSIGNVIYSDSSRLVGVASTYYSESWIAPFRTSGVYIIVAKSLISEFISLSELTCAWSSWNSSNGSGGYQPTCWNGSSWKSSSTTYEWTPKSMCTSPTQTYTTIS